MATKRDLMCACGEASALDSELVVACAEIATFMAAHAEHGKVALTMAVEAA